MTSASPVLNAEEEFDPDAFNPQLEVVVAAWKIEFGPSLPMEAMGRMVDGVVSVDRKIAELQARKALMVDMARAWAQSLEQTGTTQDATAWTAELAARKTVVTELASALRMSERSVETLVVESELLVHEFAATRESLAEGWIGYRQAQVIIDHAMSLPPEARYDFEAALLPAAKTLTAAKLDRKARVRRERLHPESITVRRQKCVQDREVRFEPARDGMAWLSLYQPAETALAAYTRLTDEALALHAVPGEARTLVQLRADVAADLLLGGVTTTGSSIRPSVQVTVPALTLMGRSEEPAVLDGYGPIDPETARRLAVGAPSFTRLLTHPETGAVLSVGRDSYVVPADLRRWLRVRDETCRFPGCNRAASRCEPDHTDDWQYGGETSAENLAHLCKYHHRLKHQTDWTYRHTSNGDLEWTSPSGRHYTTEPAVRMRPASAPPRAQQTPPPAPPQPPPEE
jgi:hypothetical protein